MKQAWKIAVN